jgi:hypothetical protein
MWNLTITIPAGMDIGLTANQVATELGEEFACDVTSNVLKSSRYKRVHNALVAVLTLKLHGAINWVDEI